jgi:uncharacterized protein (DUF1684 family)
MISWSPSPSFAVIAVAGTAVATGAAGAIDAAAHRREVEAWQKVRDARLRADGGWLTLAGLFWLKPGINRFGADASNDIVLPAPPAPARAGAFVLDGGKVHVEVAPGVPLTRAGQPVDARTLRSDAGGAEPDVLALGPLTMQVIERHGRLAIRLKNNDSPTRRQFHGLRYYPIDARYRVVARFVPHAQPVTITVPNVLGLPEAEPSPGYAELVLGGKTFRLDPVTEPGEPRLFFIFRDQTSGKTTYGSGRFLYADPPRNGQIVLDFNQAYSPPCAFTPYATCPLPPEQNRLPIPIEAGELDPHGH